MIKDKGKIYEEKEITGSLHFLGLIKKGPVNSMSLLFSNLFTVQSYKLDSTKMLQNNK